MSDTMLLKSRLNAALERNAGLHKTIEKRDKRIQELENLLDDISKAFWADMSVGCKAKIDVALGRNIIG